MITIQIVQPSEPEIEDVDYEDVTEEIKETEND